MRTRGVYSSQWTVDSLVYSSREFTVTCRGFTVRPTHLLPRASHLASPPPALRAFPTSDPRPPIPVRSHRPLSLPAQVGLEQRRPGGVVLLVKRDVTRPIRPAACVGL